MVRKGVVAALLASLAIACLWPGPASATLPGVNGKLAFERVDPYVAPQDRQVHTIAADGSGDTQITSGSPTSGSPAWGPLGKKLAWVTGSTIVVANADGSDATPIFTWTDEVGSLSWSPLGDKLAAALRTCEADECRFDVYTLGSDGSGLVDLTPDLADDRNPSWSPDGARIAFESTRNGGSDIYTIAPDGTNLQQLTPFGNATDPDWSPDGLKVAFVRAGTIYTIRQNGTQGGEGGAPGANPTWSPDGTQIVVSKAASSSCTGVSAAIFPISSTMPITHPPTVDGHCTQDVAPAWQPLPGTFVRPKGASPMHVSLVPAFGPCTSANSSHGAPLAFDSCSPPNQEPGSLTVGAPDSNGLPATSVGSLNLKVKNGDPNTNFNEAELLIDLSMTGVLRRDTLAAYDGQLAVELRLRITDFYNATDPPSFSQPATGDAVVRFSAPCTAATGGGSCQLHTGLNALTGTTLGQGYAHERRRAVWELDQVRVFDAGTDSDPATTGDNGLFAVQGLFAP